MSDGKITINGREVGFSRGETILDVARRCGVFIPTLCHLADAAPTGACRVCVVEIEGARALAPACSMPAGNGMKVHTNTPVVLKARRYVLGLLLQTGNHNCASRALAPADWASVQREVQDYDHCAELCPVYGECKLQSLAYRYQVHTTNLERLEPRYAMEDASPLIVRDFSRCVLCGRCVSACNEVQVNNAISLGYRGARAKIVALSDNSLERSDCVFCGECIQACPVGALVEKRSRYRTRPWAVEHVRTTCYYCGVGCQLDLHVKDGHIVKAEGARDAAPNRARLCVKGRFAFDFLHHPQRLARPRVRENGMLRDAGWDEALERVADRLRRALAADGPSSVGAVCSAKATNETLYVAQKFFRGVVGTNNLASPFAASGMTNSLEELERAPCLLLVGADITEDNPVAGTFVKRAARKGARLVVIDARETRIGTFASCRLQPKPGTEQLLLRGLLRALLERTPREDVKAAKELAEGFDVEGVARTTGVEAAAIREAADLLAEAESTMALYGAPCAGSAATLVAMQEVLGNLGRECGGVNFIGELNNAQGAADMGFLPDYLPGYRPVADAEARAHYGKAWGATLSDTPGQVLSDLLRRGAMPGGEAPLRVLFCSGEDVAVAGLADGETTAALERVGSLICLDALACETHRFADVVLPIAAWCEEDGTYTNAERRVSRVRRAVEPPGEARPEASVYAELARRLDHSWPERTAREIWDGEIARLVPTHAGITYDRLEGDGLQWPVRSRDEAGTPRLNGERLPLVLPQRGALNYHHRSLCEHCEGLLESLSERSGIGTHVSPSDREEVEAAFAELLEQDGLTDRRGEIDAMLAAYRVRPGGLIPVLQRMQSIVGYLPPAAQNYIALGLNVPAADVYGVVSFYSFFTMVPRGMHTIRVCLGTACYVKGSGQVLEHLLSHLHCKVGSTTEDRMFTVEGVRCVGACGLAPVVVVDERTHGMVTPSEVIEIVESIRKESAHET